MTTSPTPENLARDGWPAAIRRALHAEAEVLRLRAILADRDAGDTPGGDQLTC